MNHAYQVDMGSDFVRGITLWRDATPIHFFQGDYFWEDIRVVAMLAPVDTKMVVEFGRYLKHIETEHQRSVHESHVRDHPMSYSWTEFRAWLTVADVLADDTVVNDDTLGPCGCVDYHMADCPLKTASRDAYDPMDDYDPERGY